MPQLTITQAQTLVTNALIASRVAPENARSVASALIAAEVDGQPAHGFTRVAAYAAQARAGKVDGHARVQITRPSTASVLVDAANGFAFPAIDHTLDPLATVTRSHGIAIACIYRSHHCGQLGAHVERLATQGLVALMCANAPAAIAPWGGTKPVFGTNPIAFAAPTGNADSVPLVIDLSISKVARGKVMAAKKSGTAIPEGWALDSNGKPTTNPDAALAGTMIPAGDAKGAALALMVEVLAATLTGANHSFAASSLFDAKGAPPAIGQTIIAIDPGIASTRPFRQGITQLLDQITAQPGTRLPGSARIARRQRAASEGVTIADYLLEEINAITAAD